MLCVLSIGTFSFKEMLLPKWESVLSDHGAGRNQNDFNECMADFISKYIEPSGYRDTVEYLLTVTKPYAMSVIDASNRLEALFRFMREYPGAPANDEFDKANNATARKTALYRIMAKSYRDKFDDSNYDLEDDGYTYGQLIRFFKKFEKRDKDGRTAGNRAAAGR